MLWSENTIEMNSEMDFQWVNQYTIANTKEFTITTYPFHILFLAFQVGKGNVS